MIQSDQDYRVEWLVPERIVFTKARKYTVDSLQKNMDIVRTMIETSPQPLVHTIWDYQELSSYPKNLVQIRRAVQNLFQYPKLGYAITVNEDKVINLLAKLATDLYKVRHRSFATKNDAVGFLQIIDPTLPNV